MKAAIWPKEEWERKEPIEVGLNTQKIIEALNYLKGNFYSLNSLSIYKDGYQVFEHQNENSYENLLSRIIKKCFFLGSKINHCSGYTSMDSDGELRNVRSITKSIMSLLIGIAIDKHFISSIEDKISTYLPDYLLVSPKADISIENLLSMRSGLGQIEKNISTSLKFIKSKDWLKHIFDLPMQFKPDEKFEYNTANAHVLSAVITRSTGMSSSKFAEEYLFAPLGIKEYVWETDPKGNVFGGGNLFLKPNDMARIGYLLLNNGFWDGKEVISSDWIKRSFDRITNWDYGFFYGYLWYIKDFEHQMQKIVTYSAAGAGGQQIWIIPEYNMVIVVTSEANLIGDKSYYLNLMMNNYLTSWIER